MARAYNEELLHMFNEAAASLSNTDLVEREVLLAAFISNEEAPDFEHEGSRQQVLTKARISRNTSP